MNVHIILTATESTRLDWHIREYRDLAIECEESPASRERLRAPRARAAVQLRELMAELGYPPYAAAVFKGFAVFYDLDDDGSGRLYHVWIAPRHAKPEG